MAPKFTPGPWIARKLWHCDDCRKTDENHHWEVQNKRGHPVADIEWKVEGREIDEANARLIAEAPALLAALKTLIERSGHMSPFGSEASVKGVRLAGKYMAALDAANALIAKVEA